MESLTDAAIQQLNLGYDAENDRLLLKVGLSQDAEIPVWLTRRMVKLLWQLLQGTAIAAPDSPPKIYAVANEEAIADFAREAQEQTQAQNVVRNMQMGDAYEPRSHVLSDTPLLIASCQLIQEADGKTLLEMSARDGNLVRFNLNLELRLALTSMLQLATREADWDLKLMPVPAVGAPNLPGKVLH